jgi:hypothetical protein
VSPDEWARVAASRAQQGLPPTVQDPGTLERVAAIFRLVDPVALDRARTDLRAAAEGDDAA